MRKKWGDKAKKSESDCEAPKRDPGPEAPWSTRSSMPGCLTPRGAPPFDQGHGFPWDQGHCIFGRSCPFPFAQLIFFSMVAILNVGPPRIYLFGFIIDERIDSKILTSVFFASPKCGPTWTFIFGNSLVGERIHPAACPRAAAQLFHLQLLADEGTVPMAPKTRFRNQSPFFAV